MNTILSIAGSDSGGGAGIQADIKSSLYHNGFMTTAITAVTAQNSLGVQGVVPLQPSFVKEQINSVTSDFDIKAVKIGMLGSKELINVVKDFILKLTIPVVLDPVAISRANSKLLDDECIESLKEIFPYATLITPNKYEAKLFFDVETIEDILSCDNFGTNILFKDIEDNSDFAVDVLKTSDGKLEYFQTKRANESNTHGTGCSYSAAIATLLSYDDNIKQVITKAKEYIYEAIVNAPNLGNGNGPIKHNLKGFTC
ncbi:bifunctional hydroxymethylpyrimidine kinase/phosphomethylpyrimidine kinase [Arcobacter sp. YIC-464]|uniref:bifunctional hydroxymethylpyrimidine kinase/phosphomethylpyrimidine kinase n=1 Tax=Arcobacter sp. YIC-464 TaxID=3376631 RepID=UPI003C23EF87